MYADGRGHDDGHWADVKGVPTTGDASRTAIRPPPTYTAALRGHAAPVGTTIPPTAGPSGLPAGQCPATSDPPAGGWSPTSAGT